MDLLVSALLQQKLKIPAFLLCIKHYKRHSYTLRALVPRECATVLASMVVAQVCITPCSYVQQAIT